MSTTNVRKTNYMGKRKESTKARGCKFKDCKNTLRKENKGGYCSFHYNKNPIVKRRMRNFQKVFSKSHVTVSINVDVYEDFRNYCDEHGFSKGKKMNLILKDFLSKNSEVDK